MSKASMNNSYGDITRCKQPGKPLLCKICLTTYFMAPYTRDAHYSDHFKSAPNIHRKTKLRRLYVYQTIKRSKLTKMHLTASTLLHSRFWQLFTLQHRAAGLNLLTRPKSQSGRSIRFFLCPAEVLPANIGRDVASAGLPHEWRF